MRKGRGIWMVLLVACAFIAGVTGMGIIRHAQHKEGMVAAANGKKIIYHCPMHPQYLSDKLGTCPICGMTLVPVDENAALSGLREPTGGEAGAVKIDPTVVQNIGVTTELVTVRDLTKKIRVSATIEPDETAISNVNTKVMGWVESLYIDYTGQRVKRGQPLLTIYSPDLVSTEQEYLQALRYLHRLPGGASEAGQGALELVESSKRRLQNWDIPEEEIDAIAKSDTVGKSMTIYSPVSGVVLEKSVTAGQNVMPGVELYRIADISTVWAMANVYQEDVPFIKPGLGAKIEVSSVTGKIFSSKVEFISPILDTTTKTATVRVGIRNTADDLLKPGMFATVIISSPCALRALSVSRQAILHTGKRDVVIIALGQGRFKPQEVRLGVSAEGYTQILSGLEEGQIIVTSSQFLIDAESNLKEAVGEMGGMEMPGEK